MHLGIGKSHREHIMGSNTLYQKFFQCQSSCRISAPMSFDPSAPALAPYLSTPVPRCAVLVDRHTHKNAGSAMRSIYLDNDRKGHFTYWGYAANQYRSVAARTTSFLASEFTEIGRDGSAYAPHSANATLACRTPSMRYVLEHHYGAPSTQNILETFGPSSPLQYAATRCGCRVVFFTRLREPFSFYASFYRWTVRRTLLKTRFPSACDTAQLPCLTLIRSRPLFSQRSTGGRRATRPCMAPTLPSGHPRIYRHQYSSARSMQPGRNT